MVVLRILKYLVITIVTLAVLVAIGFFLGIFGIPHLNSIDNQFGTVNETTTEIQTNVSINNPNPIGVSVGGVKINYTVNMNDIPMARGTKEGISIQTGNSSLRFDTYLDNTKIPQWWYTHIANGEQTTVNLDARVSHSLIGGTSFNQNQSIQTDILSSFDSTETREIDANNGIVEDPVLYLNETEGAYGSDISPEQTPINLDFTVYNPKSYPYTITEVGYTIEMNGIQVGQGSTDSAKTLEPKTESVLTAETVIENAKLDQWWVSHLENDEVTDLYIDFYVEVKPAGIAGATPFKIDSDELDYRTTIETNILGSKNSTSGTRAALAPSGSPAVAPAT